VAARFSQKIRRYHTKRGQSLFCWEGRKGLVYEGSIFIFLLAGVCIFLCYQPPAEEISTAQEYYYKEIMQKFEGKFTSEKYTQIQEKIQELEALERDVEKNGSKYTPTAMEVAQNELIQLDVYRELGEYMEYLSEKKEAYILYEKGYFLLLGKEIPGGYLRLCSIMAVIMMVLMSARLWGEDEWRQTVVLCRSSRAGIQEVMRKKILWNLFYALAVGVVVYVPWIYECTKTYSLQGWFASADNLMAFSDIHFITLGGMIMCSYLLRIVYLMFVGWVTKVIQDRWKGQSLTIYAAVVLCLIPVFLTPNG
jgi:hypothetical protein